MLIDKVNASDLTPMMQQYLQIKNEYRDVILFYRLGDFYEMFFDDAITASKELELVLTGRDAGLDERVPMCGVPHHSSKSYINRLVDRGYKIGIVEQLEDPATAKGIVKRNVVKIISPGTLIDMEDKNKDNNFLLSIYLLESSFAVSYLDISTGEFKTSEFINSPNLERDLLDSIVKVNPSEIVISEDIKYKSIKDYIDNKNIYITYVDKNSSPLKDQIKQLKDYIPNLDNNLFKDKIFSVVSSLMLLDYIYVFINEKLDHIDNLLYVEHQHYMKIDANTRENLEIHTNLNDNNKNDSLLNILDRAHTPMGSRKINSWLEFPLMNVDQINHRLDIVSFLYENPILSKELSNHLDSIYDLERILAKIAYRNANAKDLILFKNSLEKLPNIKKLLVDSSSNILQTYGDKFDDLRDLYVLIDESILEDSPNTITEGNLIRSGFSNELDKLKYDSDHGKDELLDYEKLLRDQTGIGKLKVSYNKNVGYYIEVTKSYVSKVPEDFIRRQTLKNSERYITHRLNDISDMILGSQSEIIDLEYKLFTEIRSEVASAASRVKNTSDIISTLDSLNAFANLAVDNKYTRPIFNKDNYISIEDGRHPVVEVKLGLNQYIANDTQLGKDNNIIQIITGPNMAGKSTYMRQVALILLMAQIGSFVPASSCDICISDAIFTRIGASDNLAKGDSTFMVEMKEMSNIIANASENSFVILDEVGRGTGTNDGYSIAKSIVEYLSRINKSKTLFATHYHELTNLSDTLSNVENLKISIEENHGDIIFLRKIVKGKTDKSYGIEVAKLSGLPDEIIFRASQILQGLDANFDSTRQLSFDAVAQDETHLLKDVLVKELSKIDIDNMTPIKSLESLNTFVKKAKDIEND